MSAMRKSAKKGAEPRSDKEGAAPNSSKRSVAKTGQWACVAVKMSSLRNEVKALDDAFVLHMFDMLLQALLEPLNHKDRDSILNTLKECADPCP